MERILNVGVCTCTTLYHGIPEGRQLTVESLGTFTIKEFRIPGGFEHQQKALKANSCHLFIDVHQWSWREEGIVEVELNDPVPFGPRKIYRLHRGGSWNHETRLTWIRRSEDSPLYDQVEVAMKHELQKRCPTVASLDEWYLHWENMAKQLADGVKLNPR